MDDIDQICFPEGKEAALNEAREAGKPLLTTENLQKLASNTETNKALAAEVLKDLPGFLSNHFYLTAAQQKFVRTVKLDANGIKGLQAVAEQGGSVSFTQPVAAGPESKSGSIGITGPFGIGFTATWKRD